MRTPPWILTGLLFFSMACGNPASEDPGEPVTTTSEEGPPGQMVDLSTQGIPLMLNAPDKQTTMGADPQVKWNEEAGRLEVRAGDHFGLLITEEAGDMARVKADLGRDMLRKHDIMQESADRLVFRSSYPDDPALTTMHFYRVITVGDRSFVVEDVPEGRFNEQDIERMLAAVSPKGPA